MPRQAQSQPVQDGATNKSGHRNAVRANKARNRRKSKQSITATGDKTGEKTAAADVSICTFDVANLLPEILDQILGEVESDRHPYLQSHPIQDDHLIIATAWSASEHPSGVTESTLICRPKIAIRPFVRVCKGWQSIAERRLYRSIAIGTTRPFTKDGPAPFLLATLKSNPRLAGLVRELRMLQYPGPNAVAQTATHAGIISACTQLSHLTLLGFESDKLSSTLLYRSLAQLTSPHSIVIAQYSPSRGFHNGLMGLCSFSQFTLLMSRWRDIEHVVVLTEATVHNIGESRRERREKKRRIRAEEHSQAHRNTLDLSSGFQNPQVSSSLNTLSNASSPQPLSFPRLRTFCFWKPLVSESSLALIHAAAPSLTTVRCDLQSTFTPALRNALTVWAPTLRALFLTHTSQRVFNPDIESVLGNLVNLRLLHTSSDLVPPQMLHHLPALTELGYEFTFMAHVQALVEVIPQLLNLQQFLHRIHPMVFDLELRDMVEPMCRLQDICKARGITMVDSDGTDWKAMRSYLNNGMDDVGEPEQDSDDVDQDAWENPYSEGDVYSYWNDGWGQTHITFEVDGQLMRTSYRWDPDEIPDVEGLVRQLRRSVLH